VTVTAPLRLIRFWLVAIVSTIVIFILIIFAVLFRSRGPAISKFSRVWGRVVLWAAGTRLTSETRDEPRLDPCLIVANHASMMDVPAGFAAFPFDFRFVSRPFFFKVPILGWAMRLSGHVSLDPKNPRKASRVLRGIGTHFEKGKSIALFPEGTRTNDGAVGEYKRGPFLTAIQNGVPVVPACMIGVFAILPKGAIVPRGGRIHVIVGAAIETKDLHPPDARRLAQECEAWTREAFESVTL